MDRQGRQRGRPLRHSRASGNPRQRRLSRHSRTRQGPTRPPAGGGGARPVGAPPLSRGYTGHDGSSRAPMRPSPSFPRKRESRRGWLGRAARPSTCRTIAHLGTHPRKCEVAKTRRDSQDAYQSLAADGHFPQGGGVRRNFADAPGGRIHCREHCRGGGPAARVGEGFTGQGRSPAGLLASDARSESRSLPRGGSPSCGVHGAGGPCLPGRADSRAWRGGPCPCGRP